MSNMTPSEIAGLLEAEAAVNRVQLFSQAAATIRTQAEALQTATEALEEVRDGASEVALITIADQALARIEEV